MTRYLYFTNHCDHRITISKTREIAVRLHIFVLIQMPSQRFPLIHPELSWQPLHPAATPSISTSSLAVRTPFLHSTPDLVLVLRPHLLLVIPILPRVSIPPCDMFSNLSAATPLQQYVTSLGLLIRNLWQPLPVEVRYTSGDWDYPAALGILVPSRLHHLQEPPHLNHYHLL